MEQADPEHLWQVTVEHSPIGMCLVNPEGAILSANRALCRMLGYGEAELVERTFQDITHPDDLAADLAMVAECLAGERTRFRLTKRYLHADGSVVWGDLSVAIIHDEAGAPLHFVSQILDVTEQRLDRQRLLEAVSALELERKKAHAILDSTDVGLVLLDGDGVYEQMNRRHHDFLALAFPDGHKGVAGQLGAVYADDGLRVLSRDEMPTMRAVRGEEFDDHRIWVGADPETCRALSVSARVVSDATGRQVGAALAYKDITDLMRALQARDDFVATVSHELRSPLTTVLGHVEMLLDDVSLAGPVHQALEVVQRSALRLRRLVGDLLKTAQGRATATTLARAPTELTALVTDVVAASADAAETAGVELRTELPPSLTADVDADRVRQVLANLLSNAVKYTDRGGEVVVSLRTCPGNVELEVRDTGIGVDAAELEQLFAPFYRARAAAERVAPGLGLGLPIVRSIAAAHGGEVMVTSAPGTGSTFRVRGSPPRGGPRPRSEGRRGHPRSSTSSTSAANMTRRATS